MSTLGDIIITNSNVSNCFLSHHTEINTCLPILCSCIFSFVVFCCHGYDYRMLICLICFPFYKQSYRTIKVPAKFCGTYSNMSQMTFFWTCLPRLPSMVCKATTAVQCYFKTNLYL